MNYFEARQRQSDGRWNYTKMNGNMVQEVGYCCEFREFPPEMHVSEEEQEERRATAHKHHTDGHATEEEACECYKQYVLDHRLSLGRKMANQKQKCVVCGEWTQLFAEVGMAQLYVLCTEHNNRGSVEGLYRATKMCYTS